MLKLKIDAQQHPAPEGIDAIDSIIINPRSRGVLNAGEYTKYAPPHDIELVVNAIDRGNVKHEIVNRGSEVGYALIYNIYNFTDGVAFAYLIRTKGNDFNKNSLIQKN